jgi:superfamily II DNA or RNA helicase
MIPGCVFLHGSLNRKERDAGLAQVRETGCPLIGTIFKEGFDMPEIDAMIIASGGTSSKAIIQKIGRVLRVSPGKVQSEILDFYDADEESMCQRHSDSRLEVYSSEPMYEVHIVNAGEQNVA